MVLPMDLISAPFIKYSDIDEENTELIDDAWGFSSEFHDVFCLLGMLDAIPGQAVTDRLIKRIAGRK